MFWWSSLLFQGALAVLAVELAKQVRWLSSAKANREGARLCQLEGRLAVLPPHQHSGMCVGAGTPAIYGCLVLERQHFPPPLLLNSSNETESGELRLPVSGGMGAYLKIQ